MGGRTDRRTKPLIELRVRDCKRGQRTRVVDWGTGQGRKNRLPRRNGTKRPKQRVRYHFLSDCIGMYLFYGNMFPQLLLETLLVNFREIIIMKQFVFLAAGVAAVSAVAFCPGEGRNGKNKRCVANE